MKLVALALLLALTGCARFVTTQTDISYEPKTGNKIRAITTQAKASTFFDAKSDLAKFKASQTDKSQSASVGSFSSETSGTNAISLLEGVTGAVVRAAIGAARP